MPSSIKNSAQLLAAVPFMLRFYPTQSLVVAGIRSAGNAHIEVTLRVDLPPPALVHPVVEGIAHRIADQGCDAAWIAILAEGSVNGDDPPRPDVARALEVACADAGMRVLGAVWAPRVAKGAPWRCYGPCGCAGTVPDPSCSPLAAETVTAGQVTYAARTELEELIAPTDEHVLRRRAELLARRLNETASPTGRMQHDGLAGVGLLQRWAEIAGTGSPVLGDEDVVELCMALSDRLVRDAALGFALGKRAAGAERLWTALTKEAPDPASADAAVLLASGALLNGDGTLAIVALERAHKACPDHRLAALLRFLIGTGQLHPDTFRAQLAEGCQQARELLASREGESSQP